MNFIFIQPVRGHPITMTDACSNSSMLIPLLLLLLSALLLADPKSHVVVEAMMPPEDSVSSRWTDYPFFVAFLSPMLCGGVLLSTEPAWVLTAGHCVNGTAPKDIAATQVKILNSVSTSPSSWKEQGQTRKITRIIKHPSNDIAVAQLASSSPIQYAFPIPIYPSLSHMSKEESSTFSDGGDDTTNPGKNGIFVGVGYQSIELPAGQDAPRSAKTLQRTSCTITSTESSSSQSGLIFATSFAHLCHGDSGGPLLIQRPSSSSSGTNQQQQTVEQETNGRLVLIGLLSRIYNVNDLDPEKPTCPMQNDQDVDVYNAFVQVGAHLDWISESTGLSQASLLHEQNHTMSLTSSSGDGGHSVMLVVGSGPNGSTRLLLLLSMTMLAILISLI